MTSTDSNGQTTATVIVNETHATAATGDDADLGPYAQGSFKSWMLAAVLAHENVHVKQKGQFPVKYDGQGKLREHFELPAWCAGLEVLCEGVRRLKLAKLDTKAKGTKAQKAQHLPKIAASLKKLEEEKASAKGIKDKLKPGTARTDVPPQYRDPPKNRGRVRMYDPSGWCIADDHPDSPEPPLTNGDGPYASGSGYTLRVWDGVLYKQGTGKVGIDGLAEGESWAVTITPKVAGGYDDGDMVMSHYGVVTAQDEADGQVQRFSFYKEYVTAAGDNRFSLFVWPSTQTVDFAAPPFTTATRVDLQDVAIPDESRVEDPSGVTVTLDDASFEVGSTIDVSLQGPVNSSFDITAAWHYVDTVLSMGAAATLATATTDATGEATVQVTLPGWPTDDDWIPRLRLAAVFTGAGAEIDIDVRAGEVHNNPQGSLIGVWNSDLQGFGFDASSFRVPFGAEQADLLVRFTGLEDCWKLRVFATRLESSTYDDNDWEQLTTNPVNVNASGEASITLPITFSDGQVYRLTGLAWPPGENPTMGNLAAATRFDIEGVAPLYTDVIPDQEEFYVSIAEGWAHRGESLTVMLGAHEGSRAAEVDITYTIATEGQFSSPAVSVATGVSLAADADFKEVSMTAPQVTEPTIVRVEAVFTSPTSEFSPITKVTAVVVYPVDAPSGP